MQINTNLSSLNAQRNLSRTEDTLARSLQRLSSGLRINSARDDAAGLAISERMTTQIRGMTQAARNANDGISMLQTAEGAMGSAVGLLQRVRELAVQAANGTNSASDREALQQEAGQMIAEIDRIGKTTAFNGEKIFAATSGSVVGDPNKLAVLDGLKGGWLENAEKLIQQYYGITGDGATLDIELSNFTDGAGGTAARVTGQIPGSYTGKATNVTLQIDMADFVPPNLPNGGSAPFYNDRIILHEMVHATMYRSMNFASMANPAVDQTWFLEGAAEFMHGADERLAASIANVGIGGVMTRAATFGAGVGAWGGGSDDYSAAYAAVRFLHQEIKTAGGEGIKDIMTYMNQNQSATLNDAINAVTAGTYADADAFLTAFSAGGAAFIGAMNLSDADTGAIGGANADGGAVRNAETVIADSGLHGDNVLQGFNENWEQLASTSLAVTKTLQIGANVGETLSINSSAMNASALNIQNLSLVTDANATILAVDRALDYVNGERAKLGAQLNRLESTVSNLQVNVEAQTGARSRIQDADYAAETSAQIRSTILQKAALTMVAQANSAPALALRLLRN